MRILIVSDTHGKLYNLEDVLERTGPYDMLIHCGDVEGQEDWIENLAGCPVHIVAGNNDWMTDLPQEEEFEIGKYRAFLTHGHRYGVGMGPERLAEEGEDRDVDFVFCGHTHKPANEKIGNVRVLNPGSLSYPRQEGRNPSYMVMEFDQNGTPFIAIHYL